MAYSDQFDPDPAKNGTSSPPLGAPQGGLALRRVSATFRVVMAGIAECWKGVGVNPIGVRDLKSMAKQDAAAVAITGGTIGAGVTLQGSANLAFGLTAQQFYDAIFPIGNVQWFGDGAGPVPPLLVTATWVAHGAGNYVKTADINFGDEGTVIAGSFITGDAGAVSAGVSGNATLTMAQLPAGLLVNAYGETDNGGLFQKGNTARIDQDANTGGGQVHSHTVPAITAHHHSVPAPPTLVLAAYERIA